MTATAEPAVLTWATGGPYPHDYHPRTSGGFGCDPCWGCRKRPAPGARIWMNCYGDLYCDPCARHNDAAWRGQRHPFERPMFGDTYCSRCGAKRDGEQHAPDLAAIRAAVQCDHPGQQCAGRAGECLCPCEPCHERWAGYAAWESARRLAAYARGDVGYRLLG